MPSHSFSLFLAPIGAPFNMVAEWLCAAGCNDATFCTSEGIWTLDFDREAPTWEEAIESAKADVARAGLTVLRVDLLESEP